VGTVNPISEIGRAINVPKSTVHDILLGHVAWDQIKTVEQFQQQRDAIKRVLQASMIELVCQGLEQIEVKLPDASAKDAAIVVGILSEKERLIAGEATQHIGVLTRHEVEDLDGLAQRLSVELVRRRPQAEGGTAARGAVGNGRETSRVHSYPLPHDPEPIRGPGVNMR
jgi:hypothetical protein